MEGTGVMLGSFIFGRLRRVPGANGTHNSGNSRGTRNCPGSEKPLKLEQTGAINVESAVSSIKIEHCGGEHGFQ